MRDRHSGSPPPGHSSPATDQINPIPSTITTTSSFIIPSRPVRFIATLSSILLLLLCTCFVSLLTFSLPGVDGACAICSTQKDAPLEPCKNWLSNAVFLDDKVCSGDAGLPFGHIADYINGAAAVSETCKTTVTNLLCSYAATATTTTNVNSCPVLPMCQYDCVIIRACVSGTIKPGCGDTSAFVAPNTTLSPAQSGNDYARRCVYGNAVSVASSTGSAASSTGVQTVTSTNFAVATNFTFIKVLDPNNFVLQSGIDLYGANETGIGAYYGMPYRRKIKSFEQRWNSSTLPLVANVSLGDLEQNADDFPQVGINGPPTTDSYSYMSASRAKDLSKYCMQLNPKYNGTNSTEPRFIGGEDCLYANVFTPYLAFNQTHHNCTVDPCFVLPQWAPIISVGVNGTATNITKLTPDLLPVMVYIHGGNYANGSAWDVDGLALVRQSVAAGAPIIVVTFNYRLGVFGFLAHHAFSYDQSPYQTSGLYGMIDQRMLLDWVQTYIVNFGGDPYRVTLVGDGSGATMACMHVFSKLSKGKFSKAILQGGMCTTIYRSLSTCEGHGSTFAAAVSALNNSASNCIAPGVLSAKACLREQTADYLYTRYLDIHGDRFLDTSAPWMGPLIDGYHYDDYVANTIHANGWNPVPMIMGVNTMEYAPLIGPNNQVNLTVDISQLTADDVLAQARTLLTSVANDDLPVASDSTSGEVYEPHSLDGAAYFGPQNIQVYGSDEYALYWSNITTQSLADAPYNNQFHLAHLRYLADKLGVYSDLALDNQYLDALTSLYTDYYITCPMQRVIKNISFPSIETPLTYVSPQVPVYWYKFAYQSFRDRNARFGGATQGSLLPYLFGAPTDAYGSELFVNGSMPILQDQQMSVAIQTYWLNFIYYGDPSSNLTTLPIPQSPTSNTTVPSPTTFTLQTWYAAVYATTLRTNPDFMLFDFGKDPGTTNSIGPATTAESSTTTSTGTAYSSAIIECAIWEQFEHVPANNWVYEPLPTEKSTDAKQYDHCEPLVNTSFCAGLLNYNIVNIRAPFSCQADVEHFLLQMPPIIAGIGEFGVDTSNNNNWPMRQAGAYSGTQPTEAEAAAKCQDTFAFTICRLLYRPCVYNQTFANTPHQPSTVTYAAGSTTPIFDITVANSITNFTGPPCGSVCHSFRFYCPETVSYLFKPILDLYLPEPLAYEDIFDDCTSSKYWRGVEPSAHANCSIEEAFVSTPSNPTNLTNCACFNSSTPNINYWNTVDSMKPGAHPVYPTCETYTGTVCAGIINYPIYIPPGHTQAEYEALALSRQLIPLQVLAPVHTGCRESFARHTCGSIFLRCDRTADQRVLQAFDVADRYNYAIPYPQFPCRNLCTAARDQCTDLFSIAPQSIDYVQCDTKGNYAPSWTECKDPVLWNEASFTRKKDGLNWTQPVDYPPGVYDYWQFALLGATREFPDGTEVNYINLSEECNNFTTSLALSEQEGWHTTVSISCPYPLVIPDNFYAKTYSGGSCATPCASILWADDQWSLADSFFNGCVVLGFLFSLWLAASYLIFPTNRSKTYLSMFFISIFCLSLIYLMQIAYSGFKPHTFGCKNNSEPSREDDVIACTLAGASFMYFINSSVQWWMVISLDWFNSLVRKKKYTHAQLKRQVFYTHCLAWGMPAIFVIIAAATKSLGRTSTLPFCFMVDDTTVATEWGIMWIPLLVRLLLGMAFMGYVARTMYQQGTAVELAGNGSRWAWFKMQWRMIALVVFFCFVFLWLMVYRAYMLLKDKEFQSATDDWIQCLIYAKGDCGIKPKAYPVSLIWYGMIGCVGAQGIACGLFFGFERRNFVLWSGFLTGRGRNYFTRPDVDPPSKTDKEKKWGKAPDRLQSGSTRSTISPSDLKIEIDAERKKSKQSKRGPVKVHI